MLILLTIHVHMLCQSVRFSIARAAKWNPVANTHFDKAKMRKEENKKLREEQEW